VLTDVRAPWPFVPRVAVLPWPEPRPRPTRLRGWVAPGAGRSSCIFIRGSDLLHPEQVLHLLDHASQLRAIRPFHRLVQAAQAQRLNRFPLVVPVADGAADVRDLEGAHAPSSAGTAATSPFGSASGSGLAGRRPRWVRRVNSSAETPRIWAIPSTVWRCSSAAMVARTVLTGLFVPRDLVIKSLMPDSSITARMSPPDRMPVPGAAGFSSTLAAPFLSRISWGMVVPTMGTVINFFLAASTALRMASGTSPALPSPAPTRPFWSPTTTRALKENRRPPLTTLATRF